MKSRRRHSTSSEDSADSGESESEESSDSEASDSGSSEPAKRRKKHKHRDQSSGSESEQSRRRSKKRKHKKKKKKHGKKRRRSSERAESEVSETLERKHTHRRKHSNSEVSSEQHARASERSGSVGAQSQVQDGRRSESRPRQPPRYYEYRRESPRSRSRSVSRSRRAQLDKLYLGSSKDRSLHTYRHDRYDEACGYERTRQEDRYHYRQRTRYEDNYTQHHYRDKGCETRAPTCLVCGESHMGRACRYPPAPPPRHPSAPSLALRVSPGRREREERRRASPFRTHTREERSNSYRERREREPREREERSNEPDRAREPKRERDRTSPNRTDRKSRFNEDDGKTFSWGKTEVKKEAVPTDKDKPNFGLSGKLAADTNTVNGIVLKYSEPDDAKQPKRRWRLYPFKGDKALPILYIHRQSCFILGREQRAVDIPLEHPSVSKQHAALQYRATPFTRPDGSQGRRVRPYIMDLDSANGTFVNNKKIEPRRFVELLERDVIKFGFSQREYVLLHENSKDDAADDGEEPGGVTSIASVKRDKQVKQEQAHDD